MYLFLWEVNTFEEPMTAVVVANDEDSAKSLIWKLPEIDDISETYRRSEMKQTAKEGILALVSTEMYE